MRCGHFNLCPDGSLLHPWHTAGDISLARHYFVFYGPCSVRPLNSEYFYNTNFTFVPSLRSMVQFWVLCPPLTPLHWSECAACMLLRLCTIQANSQPQGPTLGPNTTLAQKRLTSQKSQYSDEEMIFTPLTFLSPPILDTRFVALHPFFIAPGCWNGMKCTFLVKDHIPIIEN